MPPTAKSRRHSLQAIGLIVLGLSILTTIPCWAAPPTGNSHFPGEKLLPREAAGPAELTKILYGNRSTINYPDNCGDAPCTVRAVASQIFKDDTGGSHAILVTAAEPTPENANHINAAVLGMAWLSHTDKGWVLDLGSPEVVTAGDFGTAPDVTIIEGGVWGKAVVLQPTDLHQGQSSRAWQLFVPDRKRGTFVIGLNIPTMVESAGACMDDPPSAACLKDDFSTKVSLSTEQDGITVVAVTSYPTVLRKRDQTKTYHVTRAGLGRLPAR